MVNPLLCRCTLPERFRQMRADSSARPAGTRTPSRCGYVLLPVLVPGLSLQGQPHGTTELSLLAARLKHCHRLRPASALC